MAKQAVSYDIIKSNIQEARNAYKEVRGDIRKGQQFNITYNFGAGHPITNLYTVEKLYPFYVLLSHISATGTKIYDGFAYEDVYAMKRTGKMIDEMSVSECSDFFGEGYDQL